MVTKDRRGVAGKIGVLCYVFRKENFQCFCALLFRQLRNSQEILALKPDFFEKVYQFAFLGCLSTI